MAKQDGNRVRVSRKDIYEIEVGDKEPLQLTEEEATKLLQSLESALGILPAETASPAPEELASTKVKAAAPAAPPPRKSKTLTPKQRTRQTLIMSGIVVIVIAAAFVAYNLQAAPSSTGGFKPPAAPYRHFSLTGENDLTFNGTSPGPTITIPNNTVVWITFTVPSTSGVSHSWVVVNGSANHNLTSPTYPPVFSNASTPDPTHGTAPGHTDQVVFTASAVGSYLYICEVPGHFESGMFGYFNVTAGNATNATSVASVQATAQSGSALAQPGIIQNMVSVRVQVSVSTAWFSEWNGD